MLYYNYKITINNEGDEYYSVEELNAKGAILNERQEYNVRFFINRIDTTGKENTISAIHLCGVIGYKNNDEPKELARQFVSDLGFGIESVEGDEITIKNFARLIKLAERNEFIDDADNVLGMAAQSDYRMLINSNYQEKLIENNELTEDRLLKEADDLYCSSLKTEVGRILAMPAKTFMGHPVHYILRMDDSEQISNVVNVLASALYKAKRLKSKRLYFVQAHPQDRGLPWDDEDIVTLNLDVLRNLYHSLPGGAIIINPGKIDYETETTDSGMTSIDDLASLISENKNDCLTITVFSKNNSSSADKFKAALSNVRFVEISDDPFFQNTARMALESLAVKDGVSDLTSLLSKIPKDETKAYYVSDVSKIYKEWKDERLCTEIFPLYSEIQPAERKPENPIGDAYNKLQNLVGLENVKKVIEEALDFCKYQKMFFDKGLSNLKPSRHMVFTGNPGTAKTTVARLFAQIMKDNKVLPKGRLVEVGRKDLVGKYVGWTAKHVERAFIEARGSVLFIDEAYSLCDDRDGMYGDEAINTIVQMMENQRDDTIVIFAGYPDKMQALLDKNPGLRSRIAFHVNFDDYNEDELIEILRLMAKEDMVGFDSSCAAKVKEILSLAVNEKDFGNGRFVRNLYERARLRQASRIVRMNPKDIDDNTLKSLIPDDFILPDELKYKPTFTPIGFAS